MIPLQSSQITFLLVVQGWIDINFYGKSHLRISTNETLNIFDCDKYLKDPNFRWSKLSAILLLFNKKRNNLNHRVELYS